ncbi:MAG: helix-turn-helix transcriptional regulator [Spirosomaceae bacterium]|jgi:AraC family transcriptional regulator, transcriptional activator of pobA|nr:helix-turn-helix transcriptional regulator [Spirosomataceae bacterium]
MTDLKTFEFHRFVESILQINTSRNYLIADQRNFAGSRLNYPYRNYFYGIGLMYEGKRRLRVGINDYTLQAGDLLVIGPGTIRHWLDDNWGIEQVAVFFTPHLFTPPINPQFLADSAIFGQSIQHVIALDSADLVFFKQLFEQVRQNEKSQKVVAALTLAMIERIELLTTVTQPHKTSRKEQISKAFCRMVNAQYLEKKDVAHYADQLNITPKYLNEAVKESTGKAPKAIIEQLIMQEAKSLLKQTQMNIKEISYWLGYDDPSYFTKAFKTAEGLLPNEYRGQ